MYVKLKTNVMKKNQLMLLSILMIALFSCSKNSTDVTQRSESEEPFVIVEQMPVFPGGDYELLQYIAKNTLYPPEAKTNGVQGKVIIRFVVEGDGSVGRVEVYSGADPLLDQEALRVIKTLPKFKPGLQDGKAVPVWVMLPITFVLR